MTTRRALLSRLALVAVGGTGLWLARDRLPGQGPDVAFAGGRPTPWLPIPGRGGLIEIDVRVAGAPLRALVDSGAQVSAIDRGAAERLGLPRRLAAPVLAYGVTGGPILADTVSLHLALPGLVVPGLPAAALPLDAIAAAADRDFQLILGRDVLRRLVVEADFARDRVRFLPPGAYRPAREALAIPLTRQGGAPTATVQVEAAASLQVLVDTGSSGVLALSEPAARAAGLLAPGRSVAAAPSLGLGGMSLDRRVVARSLRVGPVTVGNVPVQVYPAQQGRPTPEGLLGAGFLRPYRMALDLGGDRLFLVRSGLMVVPRRAEPSR